MNKKLYFEPTVSVNEFAEDEMILAGGSTVEAEIDEDDEIVDDGGLGAKQYIWD